MLKENLRMILKSKLTWIVFGCLLIITLGYTFYDIFHTYKWQQEIIINYEYLWDKPYASSSWNNFYQNFSAVLFLIVPISLCFVFYKKDTYVHTCQIRGKASKQKITQAMSIGIVTASFFFVLFLISLSSFYFTMGFKMEPWKIDFHNEEIELLGNYLNRYDTGSYFGYELYWSNNGNSTYLFYVSIGLLITVLYFFYITMASLFAFLFSNRIRIVCFIIFTYIFYFLTCIEYSFGNFFLDLVELSKVSYMRTNTYINSIIIYPCLCIGLIVLFLMIDYIVNNAKRKEMGN